MSTSSDQVDLIDKWHNINLNRKQLYDRLHVKELVYNGMIMELDQYNVTAEYLPDFTESIGHDTRSIPILMERGSESDDFQHTVIVLNDTQMNCGIFSEFAWDYQDSIEALRAATAVGFAREVTNLKLSMTEDEQRLNNLGHIILNMGETFWDNGIKKVLGLRDWQTLCKIRKREPTVAEMTHYTIRTTETASEHLDTVLRSVWNRVRPSQNARFSFIVVGSSAERVARNWLYQCMQKHVPAWETTLQVGERLVREDIFRRLVSIAWVDTVPTKMPGRSVENGTVDEDFAEWLQTNTRAFKKSDHHAMGEPIDRNNDFGVATHSYGGGERSWILPNAWKLSLSFAHQTYKADLAE